MLAFQAHSVHVEPNSEATVETDAAADTEHEEVGLNHAELIEKMDVDAELSEETDAELGGSRYSCRDSFGR